MRLFVACSPSPQINTYLQDFQSVIRDNSVKSSLTKRGHLHVTLSFIGEKKEPLSIEKALSEISLEEFPTITLKRLGGVRRRDEYLLWMELEKDVFLLKLKEEIDRALEKVGVEREKRKFHPHITLARRVLWKGEDFQSFKVKPLESKVSSFELYESKLSPQGPVYRVLHKYPIKK